MTYIEYVPIKPLCYYVEKIWYCSAGNLTANTLTIPLLNHELIFNFSDNYAVSRTNDKECIIANPVAWINGLQSKAYLSHSSGRHEMIGVLFKANGLKVFLKNSSHDFFENFIDAKLVFGKSIERLINKLQDAAVVNSKINLIENFLLENFVQINCPKYLPFSLDQLSKAFGTKGNIRNVCDQLAISNKSLIETFKKHVGINPLKYSHVQVINHAIALLAREPAQSYTKLAYKLNFYDQAHFISLFKSITSLTPSQYASYVMNKKIDRTSPNFISMEG